MRHRPCSMRPCVIGPHAMRPRRAMRIDSDSDPALTTATPCAYMSVQLPKQPTYESPAPEFIGLKPRLAFGSLHSQVSVQLPKQLVFDTRGADAARADGAADGDAWGVNLDVQELNLVLRL
eukprot:291794-Chlamydomonas_euryale.AAC.7